MKTKDGRYRAGWLHAVVFWLMLAVAPVVWAEEKEPETIITADRLELESGEEVNVFHFAGNVKIVGNNLTATGDRMRVTSRRGGGGEGTIGQIGQIGEIILEGNVRIAQAGREATCGLAKIYPGEGRVVLLESPRIMDAQGEVTGYRMELNKGERKARVFGPPAGEGGEGVQGRPSVRLPTLPDLGFKDNKETGNP